MSGYDGYETDEYADEEPYDEHAERGRVSRGGATPLGAALAGVLIGALLAAIALFAIGGNPFSDANDVVYQDVVIAQVSKAGDQICWAVDPSRRDADLRCAILAIDPAAAAPLEGEKVTVGLVALRPPDGADVQQVVYVRGSRPAEPAADDASSDDGTDSEATDGASSPADDSSAEAPAEG